MTVNSVAERFSISRPAVSKHLKILEECGVILITQSGRERYCAIQPEQLIPAFLWLDQYRQIWESRIDSFESYVQQLKTNQKNDPENEKSDGSDRDH